MGDGRSYDNPITTEGASWKFRDGKIDGSTLMPLGLSIRNTKQGKLDDLKGKKICTYCASGYRANIAAEELEKAGFDVVNLEGGFMGWQNHNNSS